MRQSDRSEWPFDIQWLGMYASAQQVPREAYICEIAAGKACRARLLVPDAPEREDRRSAAEVPEAEEPEARRLRFAFLLHNRAARGGAESPASGLPGGGEWRTLPAAPAQRMLARLEAEPDGSPQSALRRRIAAQELLLALLEARAEAAPGGAAADSVRETVDYLHRHYRESLTVGELLKRSGVGRWQYSALFRQMTGRAPLDYLNELRLDKARELLTRTDDPLREIARSVGFRDEYYFSRRFSRFMGVSPRYYVQLARRRTQAVRTAGSAPEGIPRRIAVSGGLTGDLLRLGVRPAAASLAIVRHQVAYGGELAGIADAGVSLDEQRLAPLRPDLVICESADDVRLEKLGALCRAVSIERFVPPDERLLRIGELIGRRSEAAAWTAAHADALRGAWDAAGIADGETAAAFVLVDARLYVMAGQGLAATLHRTGGFLPCAKIARMIEAGVGFRLVRLEELGEYAADRLFLMRGRGEAAHKQARLLLESGLLHRHAPSVHLLDAEWNFDDAWTRQLLAEALPALLRETAAAPAALTSPAKT
ncbi:AraC family transcriptional regulator [Saccharibacillus sp. CPCC 101409]|uniref:AraC family transcriptional regulator n=1 Tax=Saccharibacillus sp. CPCC 101409 TaxID=3058041 RepID=UPI0026728097|nr:AraC family transcriptional regulator [Saccharibacillus sp. CPCC 101409]MDO3411758.1 AraC family transcriptional regulator [Saccharibacillus sp. CPCC 101409]